MVRYLQAMASHSSRAAATRDTPPAPRPATTASRVGHGRVPVTELRVRDIMKRPVTGIGADTPFLDVARMLGRRQSGAAPVVDDERHVIGVIAESDLLAKAASLAAPERPGALSGLRRRRAHEGEGATAATLMSAPALTVQPGTLVVDAARAAARSRIRQVFVTDYQDRLVGVVSRSELLQALVRDDAEIRAEVVGRVVEGEFGLAAADVDVRVENGTVTLTGSLTAALIPRLTEAVAGIADVVEVEDHLVATA
ncbi:CBS domain-containing protein [Streptomyces justiciae]|uniref:CBS domain-containing protein n=1 Tax=Streptomyces justiciae TaxID=2780140 RepID=UPI0018820CE7|nr:CBS domain-containing protein [Streptomyces justiciae]MBE8472011.1 CBS domain-containing protein [Streptomyces justiciae]MCW8376110.1 CBS domain-containing protein [Streptomyces justiciae]